MRSVALHVVVVAACGDDGTTGGGADGAGGTIRLTASMTVASGSGTGTSPLDGLVGQTIAFTADLTGAAAEHDMNSSCHSTNWNKDAAQVTASGATAATVQAELLAHLPKWTARFELCQPATDSSATFLSQVQGLAIMIGCASSSGELAAE